MTTVAEEREAYIPSAAARLVARVLAGEESAFAQMVEEYSPAMTQICFVVAGDDTLADDAVAAAWSIVWRRIRSLREPEHLRTWLIAVAANEARRLARAQRRRWVREISLPSEDPPASSSSTFDPSAHLDLAGALARLSPDDRQLIALRYIAGFNSTELGRATGMSASGVRARLGRLLQRLRTELGDD
jgi:RNA polymerase sigma-70 factor (ECF subfamily)